MLRQKYEAAKAHVKENKAAYITGATCLVVGALGGAAVAKRTEIAEIMQCAKQINILSPGSRLNNVQIAFQERSTPSRPIFNKTNGVAYGSINEAARQSGHSASMISRNINGHISDVHGDVFEALEVA